MISEYYAVLTRETQESEGKRRIVLEFQAVEKSKLISYLEGEANDTIKASQEYNEVFQMYQEFGISDERFNSIKHRYLGQTGFRFASVYFENIEYRRYIYENWYFMRLSSDKEGLGPNAYDCANYDWGEISEPMINSYCSLELLPIENARRLRQLYKPYITQDSSAGGEDGTTDVGIINDQTQIGEVQFMYVGAALCVKILNQDGNLAAFFDLGAKIFQGRPGIGAALACYTKILEDLSAIGANNRQTIFISHWHIDHYNILGVLPDAELNNVCNYSDWYVPAEGIPAHFRFQEAVPDDQFHAFEGVLPLQNVQNNENVWVGKIALPEGEHPHHKGLYVKLVTQEGRHVLLVGDTTYEGIPIDVRTNGNDGYYCLQACHHGGDFHLPPASADNGFIPSAAQDAIAVYSADGITYGHPSNESMNAHWQAGFQYCLLYECAENGYNYFYVR